MITVDRVLDNPSHVVSCRTFVLTCRSSGQSYNRSGDCGCVVKVVCIGTLLQTLSHIMKSESHNPFVPMYCSMVLVCIGTLLQTLSHIMKSESHHPFVPMYCSMVLIKTLLLSLVPSCVLHFPKKKMCQKLVLRTVPTKGLRPRFPIRIFG